MPASSKGGPSLQYPVRPPHPASVAHSPAQGCSALIFFWRRRDRQTDSTLLGDTKNTDDRRSSGNRHNPTRHLSVTHTAHPHTGSAAATKTTSSCSCESRACERLQTRSGLAGDPAGECNTIMLASMCIVWRGNVVYDSNSILFWAKLLLIFFQNHGSKVAKKTENTLKT